MSKKCLLMIDVQKGFVSDDTEHVLPRIKDLMDYGFDHKIATQFINKENSQYVRSMDWRKLMESPDTDVIDFVQENSELVIVKNVYSAVCQELLDFLSDKRIDIVYLCGIDTDCCVLKTAADLFELDIEMKVLAHYSASNGGRESHDAALTVMERLIGTSNIIYDEL